MKALNRREFCKALGAVAVGLTLPSTWLPVMPLVPPEASLEEMMWKTFQAGTTVHYQEGRSRK